MLTDNKLAIIDKKLNRLKNDGENKLQLIEEFKLTLENMEWKEKLKDEVVAQR